VKWINIWIGRIRNWQKFSSMEVWVDRGGKTKSWAKMGIVSKFLVVRWSERGHWPAFRCSSSDFFQFFNQTSSRLMHSSYFVLIVRNYKIIEEGVALKAEGIFGGRREWGWGGGLHSQKFPMPSYDTGPPPPQLGPAILKKLIRNLSDKVTKIPC